MSAAIRPVEVVVVGSASRDITADDPRGWRLGGGATYSALAMARLGLGTAAVLGVDGPAADAHELDLLRAAGVRLHLARLERAPVFENHERPSGRVQECLEPGIPLAPEELPDDWRGAPAWIVAPVAGEIEDGWAALPRDGAFVTLGWQGLLRDLAAGRTVRHRPPVRSALLERADLVGVSEGDVPAGYPVGALTALLRSGTRLVITRGGEGGHLVEVGPANEAIDVAEYPVAPTVRPVDPTGAGDTFLAALTASAIAGRLDLAFAAAAASLVVEGPGLAAVPRRTAVLRRMAEAARDLAGRDGAPGRGS